MGFPLLTLPHELLHGILVNVDPQDLAAVCCCRQLAHFVKNNVLLFKTLYLKQFDAPTGVVDFSWISELQKLVGIQKICESKDKQLKRAQLPAIVQSVDHLLKTAAKEAEVSHNIKYLARLIQRPDNSHDLLHQSSLYAWVMSTYLSKSPKAQRAQRITRSLAWRNPELDVTTTEGPKEFEAFKARYFASIEGHIDQKTVHQASAKLHCLHGSITVAETSSFELFFSERSHDVMEYARSRVYDLQNYKTENLWGPFSDDGTQRADWEKLEAIMILIDGNVDDNWSKPFTGVSPNSYDSLPSSIPTGLSQSLEAQDPYGITGTWDRVVCFLDYTQFYAFNFSDDDREYFGPRGPLCREEATRFIVMRLSVTSIEAPGEDDGQSLPVVHFKGDAALADPSFAQGTASKIHGTVRLTPHREVRWTSISVFHGEERWKSEGIQLGGPRSARGVLGTWFDKDYDRHGPCGPTAFFKTSNSIEELAASLI